MKRKLKNCFIIHGSFGNSKEHYLPWLSEKLQKNYNVFVLDFPIGEENQSYYSWKQVLDEYKNFINKDTTFIGRSIAPIFIVRYILENKLKISALYSISGFNGFINIPEYDSVNKTFLMEEILGFEKYCKKRVCILSKNDPYVPYYLLDMFSKNIKSKIILINDGGHFNQESGYSTFPQLLKLIEAKF